MTIPDTSKERRDNILIAYFHNCLKDLLKNNAIAILDLSMIKEENQEFYTLNVRDGVLAISHCSHRGIFPIRRCTDEMFQEKVDRLIQDHGRWNTYLTAASDGYELYILSTDGSVISTKEDWYNISLFTFPREVYRHMMVLKEQLFTPQELEETLANLINGTPFYLNHRNDEIYYDKAQKALIFSTIHASRQYGCARSYSAIVSPSRFYFDNLINCVLDKRMIWVFLIDALELASNITGITVPDDELLPC